MTRNDIERDYPCDGDLLELTERCTATLTVKLCLGCGRGFRYVPDSDWVTVVLPGTNRPLD
jgi:hypothetical protein